MKDKETPAGTDTDRVLEQERQLEDIQVLAGRVATELQSAWQRPHHHNLKVERHALWLATLLAVSCTQYQQRIDEYGRVPMLPQTFDTEARYRLAAALCVLPHLLPYTRDERDALASKAHGPGQAGWQINVEEEGIKGIGYFYPDLVQRWHRWLWAPAPESSVEASVPSPESQMFALGCVEVTRDSGDAAPGR